MTTFIIIFILLTIGFILLYEIEKRKNIKLQKQLELYQTIRENRKKDNHLDNYTLKMKKVNNKQIYVGFEN